MTKTIAEFKEYFYWQYVEYIERDFVARQRQNKQAQVHHVSKEIFTDLMLKAVSDYIRKDAPETGEMSEDALDVFEHIKKFRRDFLNPASKITVVDIYEELQAFSQRTQKFLDLLSHWHKETDAQVILQQGINVDSIKNNEGKPLLTLAIERGCFGLVDMLLIYKADVNKRDIWGKTPLHAALSINKYPLTVFKQKVVERLIVIGADTKNLDNQGTSALGLAMKLQDKNMVDFLFSIGEKPTGSIYNVPILNYLVKNKEYDFFMPALNVKEIDIETRDEYGNTPLLNACEIEKIGHCYAEPLLKLGANVNAQNQCGQTPLMLAYYAGNLDVFKAILNTGKADLTLQDNLNRSISFILEDADGYNAAPFKQLLSKPILIAKATTMERSYLNWLRPNVLSVNDQDNQGYITWLRSNASDRQNS